MYRMKRLHLYIMMILAAGLALGRNECCAQTAKHEGKEILHYIIEGKDTIYIDQIKASKVYSKLPRQKGKDWRKYYRLVHNFSKTYPYALAARKIVARPTAPLPPTSSSAQRETNTSTRYRRSCSMCSRNR